MTSDKKLNRAMEPETILKMSYCKMSRYKNKETKFMRKLIILLSLLHLFFFTSIAQTNIIDSIKIMPRNISVSDPIFFAMYAHPFSGGCTHQFNVDSIIIDTKIYISGKFDSNDKCGALWDKEVNDTINIGLLPAGTYELIYTLIDINHYGARYLPETYSIEFVVSLSSEVQEVKIKEFELYPNPCDSYVNIVFSNIDNEIKHIQLFDIVGKMIYEKNVNQNSLQINMSSYNQGIYFIRITNNKNEYKYKIIKR